MYPLQQEMLCGWLYHVGREQLWEKAAQSLEGWIHAHFLQWSPRKHGALTCIACAASAKTLHLLPYQQKGGLFPSSASVQSLPRPMLNSTGVRYPLLFCSKLSKTVSSCSGVRGSSLWSRCKDKRTNKLEAQLKSSLWLYLPCSALAHSNVPFQHCIQGATVCQQSWAMTQTPGWRQWQVDFFHYWMIQPGLQRGNFRLFCLEKAQPTSYPATEPLSLAQCLPSPIPAQRGHCQPPVTTAALRRALGTPAPCLWPGKQVRLADIWIQFQALADPKGNVQSMTASQLSSVTFCLLGLHHYSHSVKEQNSSPS